jgi:hypothetical protein
MASIAEAGRRLATVRLRSAHEWVGRLACR